MELRGFALAGVNLVAFAMQPEKELFVGGRLERLRDFLLLWLRGLLCNERDRTK